MSEFRYFRFEIMQDVSNKSSFTAPCSVLSVPFGDPGAAAGEGDQSTDLPGPSVPQSKVQEDIHLPPYSYIVFNVHNVNVIARNDVGSYSMTQGQKFGNSSSDGLGISNSLGSVIGHCRNKELLVHAISDLNYITPVSFSPSDLLY